MENNTLPESFALNELQRIEKEEVESRATAALASSEGKSPDLVAETQRLSSKFGYSPDVIERNLDEFKRREKVEGIDINGLLEGNADALAWVADPKNAPLVSDDPSILARVAKNIKDFPSSVGDSVDTQSLIELRYKQMWGGLTPEEMVQADELSRKMDSTVRGTGGFWSEGFQAVGSNSVQMARTMGAGLAGGLSGRGIGMVIGGAAGALVGGVGAVPGAVAGGNIGGTVGGVGGAAYENFRQQSALVYNDMLKLTDENGKGVDPDVARGSAIVVGGINAGLDLIAFNKLAKTIPGFERVQAFLSRGGIEKAIKMPGLRQALATIGKKYASGVTYEALTEGAQELTQIIGEGFVKDNSDGNFSETPVSDGVARVARATAGGAGMAIFMGGAGSSVSAIKEYKNRNTMPPEKVMAHVDAINETVRDPNNKLFQRSPEAFHDYVSKIAPEDAFYVNGDAALQMVLSLPDDQRAALFNSMPNLRTELETAASAGSDVSISKADYATYIAPTSIAEMLKPYMKVDPEGKSLHDIQMEQAFAKDNPQAAQAMQNLLRSIPEGEQAKEVGGMVQRLIRKSLSDAGANEGEVKTASSLFAAQARQYYRLFGDKWKDHFLGSLLEFQAEDETGQPVKKGSNFSVLLNDLEKLKAGKAISGMDDETRAAVEQFGKRIEDAGLTPQEVRGMESTKLVDTLFAPRSAPVVEIGDVAVTMPDVQVEQTPEGNVTIQQAPSEEDLQRTKDTLNRYVQVQREVAERTRQEAQAQRDQDQRVKEAETIKEHLPETKSEEQGVKPEPVVEKKPDATKIEDFGQKLEGARKDVWQKYNAAMQEKIPTDLKDVTLTKYFPEPDYEDMIARGVGQAELAVVKAMRDMVPAKPRNPTELRIWANKLNEYRDLANDILNGTFTAQGLLDHLTSKGGYLTLSLRDKLQLYIDVGYPAFRSVKGWEIDRRAFTEYMGQKFSPAQTMWFFKSPQREYSAPFVERSDMVASLREAILKKPDDKGAVEVKFDIYQNTKTGEIFIGKKIGAGKFIDLKGGFTKASEARAYLKENKEALSNLLEKMKEIRPERREKNEPRVGKDYRNGTPVTPEKFMAEFGFRGVQFGNYVEQAKRSEDMDRSYDALLDMAAIIGIPTRALSLNGSLGIAFGARGKGGKGAPAAHYEPGQVVINLTKGQGAGSLAHEWFHALDNYFGTQGDDKYGTTGETNATVRPEVREAFLNITKVLQKSGMYSRSLLRDQRRSGKAYWTKRIEMGARAFEAYIAFKLKEQGLSNDFLVNIVDEDVERVFNEMQGRKNDHAYPTREEMPEVAQAFEAFLGLLKTEETEAGVKLYQAEEKTDDPSDEFFDETKLREAKNQSQYSREKLVYMSPENFLKMAEQRKDVRQTKRETVDGVIERGEKFSSIPMLGFENNGDGTASVVSHEGRHRADALIRLGVERMPVVLKSIEGGKGQTIRWGVFDGDLPTKLLSETKGFSEIDFPSSDVLYQQEKGSFTRKKSEDFMERMRHVVISMTKDKNMSTLAHEFAHYAVASHRAFAQMAKEMQLQGDGRKELQTFIEDWEALKNAVGAKDDKFTTEQEEQVARWFEGYLREGKAPSDRLRPVFSRFKSWLVSIYRDVQAYMGAEMPKEVEEAFNRWLASEDEIQTALGRNASIMEIVKQFNVEGLEDRITQHLADAIQIAEERQYKKHLAEDRKRETTAYKNEYATLRKQVYAEKIKEPVYAALNWMKGNDVRFALEYVTKRTRGFNKKPPAWASFEPILSRHWHVVEDIKDLRDPRRVKPPKVRSLLQFIASKGGIQDIGGDLKSMGGDSVKGLINKKGTEAAKTNRSGGMFGKQETSSSKKNGYSYDAMMEAVAEEGYFNRDMFGGDKALDYRDMLELIEKELGGSPVYRADDMDEVHDYETRLKRMEEFDRILSENGLDAKRDSTVAILKRLEEIGLIDHGFEFEEREGEQPNEEPVYDAPDNLPQKDPELRKKITEDIVAEDGVSPDMIAERFGFDSGESLLKAIEKAQNFEFAVDAEARRRLHEKYTSMVDDGRIRVEAIESLYNDKTLVALDVLISEIGKTKGRTNNPGLRQFATALSLRQVELTKMGDANKTFRFEIARERELKAALQASREGNAEQAMLHLQRAMVAQLVFKRLENFKAVKERAMALFGKVDQKDKDLAPSRDMDFIGAARFLLFKFGLGGENFQFQTWLEDLRGRDDNLIQDIAQAAGLMSDSVLPKNAKELTVSEFVEVYNAIKNLYKVARQAKEIEKEGRRIKIKTVVGELIEKMGGAVGEANPSTSFTKGQKIMQGVHSVRSALRRVEQWCGAMDGGTEGPFTTYIWHPISKAQAAFEAANDEWQSRYSSILKKYADSFKVPGKVETQLIKHDELGRPTKLIFNDRNALIGFMLHLGNESNMDKLLGGYGIDPDSVWSEIDRLEKTGAITGKDWELCQSLWDLMEEIKPQIQEAHRKLYGYRFTEIEPTPIIRGGKAFRGGYWPAVVQRGLSTNINALADVYENPAAYIIASTGRGFTKERTKGYREALVTDVRLGSSHLEQVNRFIHIEPAVREVSRIVNDGDFKAVLNTHDQSVHGDMIMPWLRRVARQEMEVIDKSSKFNRVVQTFSRFMRSSMSAQYIAYNIKVAAQDVANLSVVLHHVGPVRFAKAFTAMLTSRDTLKDVRSMSAMMENRFNQKGEKAQVLIDQIVEGKGVFGKTKDFTRLHGNLFIQVIDGYLSSAGWQAAFNKGVEEGMDDAGAVQYADRVVRDAFGSMTPSDVSAFEANHPVMRVLFPFMSYFIAQSNVAQTEIGNIMMEYGWAGAPRLFMAYVSIIAAPAAIGQAIVDAMSGRMPDDDEGLDGWLAWLTESQLAYVLGMIPGGNIVGSGIKYLYKKPNDLRASFNPLGSIGASAGRTIYTTKQVIEGQDVDEGKYLRDLLTTIGFITGVPLGQVAKPISYAVDVANDKQSPDGPYDVLVGTVSGRQPKR